MGKEAEGEVANDGGDECSADKFEGGDAAFEMSIQDALTRGVGGVGNDGQSATGYRSGNDSVFGSGADAIDLRGQVGDRGVVVEGGKNRGTQHEGVVGEGENDRFDPPCLTTAVNDEGSEEKPDEDGAAHGNGVLVVSGGDHEGHEEEESSDEEDRGVGIKHRPSEEEEVCQNHPDGNWIIAIVPSNGVGDAVLDAVRGVLHAEEFFAEQSEVEEVAEEDCDHCFPAEVEEHEFHAPVPSAGDHENGRGGEVGEGAADRDVDEKQAEGGIGEADFRAEDVEFFGKEKGADGHRGRFGDEGAEDGRDGENTEPPCAGGSVAECRGTGHDEFGESKNGTARGDGHDDDHEGGFDELTVVADIAFEIAPGIEADRSSGEGDDPDAENGFDLSEEVESGGFERHIVLGVIMRFGAGGAAFLMNAFVVFVFGLVGGLVDGAGGEGMADGEQEDDCGDEVEWICADAGFDRLEEVDVALSVCFGGELVSRDGECGVLDFPAVLSGVGRFGAMATGCVAERRKGEEEAQEQGDGTGFHHVSARRL